MQLFFAGAESQAHLDTLKSCGVERVAISVANLARHTTDYSKWASQGRLAGLDWLIYADSPTCPVQPMLELLGGSTSDPEAIVGPASWSDGTWLADSDLLFLPIWDGHDASELRHFVETYDGVVLTDSVVDNHTAVRTAKASMGRMSALGGLTGRSKGIERFDLLISSAWWAVPKHGETQVWAGNRLIRMNKDDKHLKRQRYAEAIKELGADLSAVLADDPKETARLAVLSWLALEQHLNAGNSASMTPVPVPFRGPPLVTSGASATPVQIGTGSPGVANAPSQTGHGRTRILPILGTTRVEVEDGPGYETIEVVATSMRQCNSCALNLVCPGHAPGASCSYNIPVVIRTKDQRQAVLRALCEIQTQRIMMGTFAEQVTGNHDVQVGREMDRLFNMVKTWKEIEETTTRLNIGIQATGADPDGSMGMISRLFGSQAGENARLLDIPVTSDELIEEADMVDASPQ